MRYISIDQLEQFDIRDHYWELASWDEQMIAVRVSEPAVLSGEHAGKQIGEALVTFQGVRVDEVFTFEGETKCSMTYEEARKLFAKVPLFVFSYYLDDTSCEFCGLGYENLMGMIFDFDSVTVEWNEFLEAPIGELIQT